MIIMNFFPKNESKELRDLMDRCTQEIDGAIKNIGRFPQHLVFAQYLRETYLNPLEDLAHKHNPQAKPKLG